MLPQKLRLGLAIFLIAILSGYHLPALKAEPIAAPCTAILDSPSSGDSTIQKLGNKIDKAALINRLSASELTNLLRNMPTFNLDICGKAFYAESMIIPQMSPLPVPNYFLPALSVNKTPLRSSGLYVDYKSVFKLHSSPGSSKTIYLDFDGEKIENTSWNRNFNNGATWYAAGFSQDSDFQNFSESELEVIQSVWLRVAEDFAAFDVDVTTELPAPGVLERSSSTDDRFGTRALISNDTIIFNRCKCSGLAYVGVFDSIGTIHDINQPAWIFTQGVGDNPKFIAEAVTHEVGHTLGLSHDGSKSTSYYGGANGWAPIMGVGFYQPITQWSKGDYPDADNQEDDLAIMKLHGLTIRQDEDDNNAKSARKIVENQPLGGVITTITDVDFFAFTPTSAGDFTFTANTASISPNLDISLTLYPLNKPSEKLIINPPISSSTTDTTEGLSATFTKKLNVGITYILELDGNAVIDKENISFTNYGNLGTYKVVITKGKSTAKPTISSGASKSEVESLPDKLVLPLKSPNGDAPLELPRDTLNSPRFGSPYLITA